jgi:hypothetical protein
MVKLTKKRITNKRNRNISSIRRKRMASRRKRQVGGTSIPLPKTITFRVYQSTKDFPTNEECDKNPKSECKILMTCPEKWYKDTDNTPRYLNVEATKKNLGVMSDKIDDSESLLDTLEENYDFTFNTSVHIWTDMGNRLPKEGELREIYRKTSFSLKEIRKIIQFYYFLEGHDFAQYIGEYGEPTKTIIAWCDVYKDEDDRKTKPCPSPGRYGGKKIPDCVAENFSWRDSNTKGPSC